MRRRYQMLSYILILLCCVSWKYPQQSLIKQARWLIGTWKNETKNGVLYETWKQINEHEFAAKSYILKGKDTTILETVKLIEQPDGVFYVPTVSNQNQGKPIRFLASAIANKQLIFENAAHDFPQRITYTKIGRDSLVAEISGTKNGKFQRQVFQCTVIVN